MHTLTFTYRGYNFKRYLVPYEEAPGIRKGIQQELEQLFDKYSGKLSFDCLKRSQSIDWKPFIDSDKAEKIEIIELLHSLSVLSYVRENHWEIISGMASLSPRHPSSGSTLYFTTQEGVAYYAALEYGNTAYSWWIVQYRCVFNRDEVMRLMY